MARMFASTEAALLRRVATEQADSRTPSLIAAVVRGDEVLWSGARGLVGGAAPTVDTQYRIGSITKSLVAIMVMRLRDEGRLALTDRLEQHVPGTALGGLTIAQLLSHTSGITAESPGQWWERTPGADFGALATSLADGAQRHRPGALFHYSNAGFGLLGEVVARIRGTSWYEALRAEVLDPLGMTRTTPMPRAPHASGFAVHPYADVLLPEPAEDAVAMAPAGQLWSTVTDQARLLRFIAGDTGGVLRADTLTEMRRHEQVDDGDTWVSGYGLGLQVLREKGRRIAGHGGSMPGFLASVFVDVRTGTGALALTNTTAGVMIMGLALDLIETVDTEEPALPDEWQPLAEFDPELLALTGNWFWGPTPYVLKLAIGRWLTLSPAGGRGRASRFRPNPDGTWTGLDGYYSGETLRVVRAGDGVTHLDVATFVFTREPYGDPKAVPGGVDERGWRGGH